MREHNHHADTLTEVSGDLVQPKWSVEKLDEMQKIVNNFKRVLIKTFHEHFDSGRYIFMYYLLNYSVNYIQGFEMLCILDSCRYEHFKVLTKKVYTGTSRSTQ